MTTGDSYRRTAAELLAKGLRAREEPLAVQYNALAQAYLRLARQADQNSGADVWAEFGPKPRLQA
jgi:hypothetical protein